MHPTLQGDGVQSGMPAGPKLARGSTEGGIAVDRTAVDRTTVVRTDAVSGKQLEVEAE